MNDRIWRSTMFSDYVFNELLRFLIFVRGSFDEHIPQVTARDFFLRHLNLGATVLLKSSNCLSSLANNKSNTVVRYWNNVGVRWRRTVRGHHAIVHHAYDRCCWIVKLGSNCELLLSNFVPRCIISCDNSLNCILCPSDIFRCIANDQHVLFIIVIWLWGWTLLLRAFSSDEDFAAWLFFESFLIKAFGSNQHPYIVDSSVFWQVDLLFNLWWILQSVK